jgi:hypothetical protein
MVKDTRKKISKESIWESNLRSRKGLLKKMEKFSELAGMKTSCEEVWEIRIRAKKIQRWGDRMVKNSRNYEEKKNNVRKEDLEVK